MSRMMDQGQIKNVCYWPTKKAASKKFDTAFAQYDLKDY